MEYWCTAHITVAVAYFLKRVSPSLYSHAAARKKCLLIWVMLLHIWNIGQLPISINIFHVESFKKKFKAVIELNEPTIQHDTSCTLESFSVLLQEEPHTRYFLPWIGIKIRQTRYWGNAPFSVKISKVLFSRRTQLYSYYKICVK